MRNIRGKKPIWQNYNHGLKVLSHQDAKYKEISKNRFRDQHLLYLIYKHQVSLVSSIQLVSHQPLCLDKDTLPFKTWYLWVKIIFYKILFFPHRLNWSALATYNGAEPSPAMTAAHVGITSHPDLTATAAVSIAFISLSVEEDLFSFCVENLFTKDSIADAADIARIMFRTPSSTVVSGEK